MSIYSINDITKKPLSKYEIDGLIKDLDELKKNGGITKVKDFDKLMAYFMKSKTYMNQIYNIEKAFEYAQIFEKILEMHPENGIYTDEQMLYLCEKAILNNTFLEKLLNRGYTIKYDHIVSYLTKFYNFSSSYYGDYDVKKTIVNNIIKAFINRPKIDPSEYVNVDSSKYDIDINILFNSMYFKGGSNMEMDNSDKKFIKDFIIKSNLFDNFFNKLIVNEDKFSVKLPIIRHSDWTIKNELLNKYKYDILFINGVINVYDIYNRLTGLDYYDILLDNDLKNVFESKYSILNESVNTTFICNFYKEYYINENLNDVIFIKFKDFFDYYNNKFTNIVDRLKKINDKIMLNDVLLTYSYHNII